MRVDRGSVRIASILQPPPCSLLIFVIVINDPTYDHHLTHFYYCRPQNRSGINVGRWIWWNEPGKKIRIPRPKGQKLINYFPTLVLSCPFPYLMLGISYHKRQNYIDNLALRVHITYFFNNIWSRFILKRVRENNARSKWVRTICGSFPSKEIFLTILRHPKRHWTLRSETENSRRYLTVMSMCTKHRGYKVERPSRWSVFPRPKRTRLEPILPDLHGSRSTSFEMSVGYVLEVNSSTVNFCL